MGHLSGDDGVLSHHGVWKVRNYVIPNNKESRPEALRDKNGNLITNPESTKRIYLGEILKRVRNRKLHPRLLELQVLKQGLCAKRLIFASQRKSAPWTMKHLKEVRKILKKKKCRDPQGNVKVI